MRTTVDIDDDILLAAKELARQQGTSAGRVLSELARRGLASGSTSRSQPEGRVRHGIPVLRSRGEVVTLEKVQRLAEEEGV
jgi:hypothetical protein